MEKKETTRLKSNAAAGLSSAIGSAAGVVGGSMFTQEAHAAEVTADDVIINAEPQDEVEIVEVPPTATHTSHTDAGYHVINLNESHEAQHVTEHSDDPIDGPTPQPVSETELEVEVVEYATETLDDGSQMDVAVLSAGGQAVMVADIDMDGYADFAASDLNNNGELDDGEVVDLSGESIAMQPFADAANAMGDDALAQTADLDLDTDYVNDANVDDYLA